MTISLYRFGAGRQRDEGAGDGLHRVLPLRAVLAADAVDLVERKCSHFC